MTDGRLTSTINPNPYDDDFKQAGEYLRLVLAKFSQHQLAPSPINFRIGYDYIAGDKALKSAFESIINTPEIDHQDALWKLYQKHFIQDDGSLEAMRQELKQIATNIHADLESSDGNITAYSKTLNQFSEVLASPISHEDMADKVNVMVSETQIAEESQKALNVTLSSAMAEIDTLRKELHQAKTESLTDALTDISNRKAFDNSLDELIEESSQNEAPFCLVIGDIDHFKVFNDTYGHLVGDKVLRFVATILKRSVKGKDTVARYGGEEFAILLPDTDLTGAHIVAEQIRSAISAGKLKNKAGDKNYGQITMSLGISQYRANDIPTAIIKRADDALYLAKENGRNRIEKAA